MDTMEDILADCNEVFRYDETRPQDRAHAYLKEHRVCRGYDDTAMERASQDMIERAYTVGRMESSKAVARETARIIAEGNSQGAGHHARRGAEMRFEITEVHVVDIPDSEVEEMDNPLEEIKDDAHWFIETYEREAWCEEVTRLGRQL